MRRSFHRFSFRRLLLALCALSLMAASCGGDSSPDTTAAAAQTTAAVGSEATTSTAAAPQTTTTAAPPETTSTTASPQTTTAAEPVPEFEPMVLAYRYPASGEVSYQMSIQQEAEVTIEGGPPGETPPGPIGVSSTLEGTISYRTSPGPDEGATSIRILSDLELVENKMSMGGITMPSPPDGEAPGFETPIDITVIVDQQGNVVEVAGEAMGEMFGGQSLFPTNSIGNQELNRPFGPAFPDHPLDVGDTWTEEIEQEGPAGMGTIVTTAEHRLVGVDTEEGRTILVVESEYRTDAFEWDMSELLTGMFGAFAEELSEEGEEFAPEFTMLMSATPSTVVAVTRFDSEAGLVLTGDYQVSGGVTTNMTIPDETGEPTGIISTVSYDQTVTYQLINPAA